jgi:hypothetical protein
MFNSTFFNENLVESPLPGSKASEAQFRSAPAMGSSASLMFLVLLIMRRFLEFREVSQ